MREGLDLFRPTGTSLAADAEKLNVPTRAVIRPHGTIESDQPDYLSEEKVASCQS